MKNRTLVYALAGLGAIALLFVKRKRPKDFNRRDALRLAPLTADAVAIGKSYRSYPDRVKTLVDFQVAAGLGAMADADGYYGPSARGALVYWLGEQGIDASRAPPALYGSSTKPYRLPVVPPELEIKRYAPHSAEAIALFEKAAPLAFGPASPNGVPTSWASEPGLHNILDKESDGFVGRPNYTYRDRATQESEWNGVLDELREGQITATSSATGLGQLLLRNVEKYYPSGRLGLGVPVEEAAGMLAYIADRYGDPANAWASYGKMGHEGY